MQCGEAVCETGIHRFRHVKSGKKHFDIVPELQYDGCRLTWK